MIKSADEMLQRMIEIDLRGPKGNAFVLIKAARQLGRQLGYPKSKINGIVRVMMFLDYESLIRTFDSQFGDYVILYR